MADSYFFNDTVYDPVNDPVIKFTVCAGLAWGAWMILKTGKKNKSKPERRKNRAALTLGHIDKQIDGRNSTAGKRVKSVSNVPHYSRHNYNRRRRPTMVS